MNEETDQQGRRSLEDAARGPDAVARPDVAPTSDEPRERSAARGPDGSAHDDTTPSASGPVASPRVEPRRSGLERALAPLIYRAIDAPATTEESKR